MGGSRSLDVGGAKTTAASTMDRPLDDPLRGLHIRRPPSLSALLHLQRTAGNAATVRLVQRQPVEVDLESVSPADAERARQQGIQLPSVSASTWRELGGAPYTTVLPGYAQEGDTCGAASLVSALMIWDRDNWNPDQPNSRTVAASNLILGEFLRRRPAAVARWVERPPRGSGSICGGDRECLRLALDMVAGRLITDLQSVRDAARQPGGAVSQDGYHHLSMAMYFLWHSQGSGGLTETEIAELRTALGLNSTDPSASGSIRSLDEIYVSPALITLRPGDIAQVRWFVTTGQEHVFLIGRLRSGQWFQSDQGSSPVAEFRAADLSELAGQVRTAARSNSYWLFAGSTEDYRQRTGLVAPATSLSVLTPGTQAKAQDLLAPNAFLGEVDAGLLTIGNRITRDQFVATAYTLGEAQGRLTSGGGVIVEMPQGVFTVYSTSTVSEANLRETTLDASDSASAALVGRRFVHAWLVLGTGAGRRGSWFSVY